MVYSVDIQLFCRHFQFFILIFIKSYYYDRIFTIYSRLVNYVYYVVPAVDLQHSVKFKVQTKIAKLLKKYWRKTLFCKTSLILLCFSDTHYLWSSIVLRIIFVASSHLSEGFKSCHIVLLTDNYGDGEEIVFSQFWENS